MGFNTTVLILNDALGEISRDRNFGQKLAEAINVVGDKPIIVPAGSYANAAIVIETHHADFTTLVAVGGNYATVLYSRGYSIHHTKESRWDLLEEALDNLSRPDQ